MVLSESTEEVNLTDYRWRLASALGNIVSEANILLSISEDTGQRLRQRLLQTGDDTTNVDVEIATSSAETAAAVSSMLSSLDTNTTEMPIGTVLPVTSETVVNPAPSPPPPSPTPPPPSPPLPPYAPGECRDMLSLIHI